MKYPLVVGDPVVAIHCPACGRTTQVLVKDDGIPAECWKCLKEDEECN